MVCKNSRENEVYQKSKLESLGFKKKEVSKESGIIKEHFEENIARSIWKELYYFEAWPI